MEMEDYIDPNELYRMDAIPWEDFWDSSESLGRNIESVVREILWLPYEEQYQIAVAYLLINSKWAKILGYLFSFGREGSGKSTLAKIGCAVHGQKQALQPSITFASLRNFIDDQRFWDEDRKFEKDGAFLAWDNLPFKVLEENAFIWTLILCGYDRATEVTFIADNKGQNIQFFTFCAKVFSSTEPLHTINPELGRRLFVIRHEKPPVNIEKTDFSSVDWTGISEQYFDFWKIRDNCVRYASLRNTLSRKNNVIKRRCNLPSDRWTISLDLIITGVVTGIWETAELAAEAVSFYWEKLDAQKDLYESATSQILKEFINQEVGRAEIEAEQIKSQGWNLELPEILIEPEKLKNHIVRANLEGRLDTKADTKTITREMSKLGWKLTKRGWVKV